LQVKIDERRSKELKYTPGRDVFIPITISEEYLNVYLKLGIDDDIINMKLLGDMTILSKD
jgi:hypothetical protein